MSTHTATAPPAGHRVAAPARVPSAGLLRSEWVKLRSLRSTWWTLGGALVFMVLLALIFAGSAASGGPGPGGPGGEAVATDPTSVSLAGHNLAQLAIAVLGVLLVTGEYASGSIRSTVAAVPRRWPVVVAKGVVLAAVLWVTSTAAAFASFAAGQALYGEDAASLADDGVLRAVLGTGLYLTAVGLLAMGVAWVSRSTAAAVSVVVALLLILPGLTLLLPDSWGPDVAKWLPGQAGQSIMSLVTDATAFAPWTGFAVLLGWVAVALGVGTALLTRRDV